MQKPPNRPETKLAAANPAPRETAPDFNLTSPETQTGLPQNSEPVESGAETDAADQKEALERIQTAGGDHKPPAAKNLFQEESKDSARTVVEHFNRRGSVNLAEAIDLEAAIVEQDRDDQLTA